MRPRARLEEAGDSTPQGARERAGASRMQFLTQIPVDIIQVIQALVLIFVAAPAIVRWLYRLRTPRGGEINSDEELGISAAAGEGVI